MLTLTVIGLAVFIWSLVLSYIATERHYQNLERACPVIGIGGLFLLFVAGTGCLVQIINS